MLFTIIFFITGTAHSAFSSERNSPPLKEKSYHLKVSQKEINITGKSKKALVINESLPAPTLFFNRGDKAVIYVTNSLDTETSIHWHGILLPNFEDGVPYLTSPPIQPGKTHKFEFLIDQSPGTYWYHSHTGLQEQEGLYGAFIIKEKPEKKLKDLVLVLSDWTDEKATEVIRNLKRGNEWYAIQKGAALSLFRLIKNKALIPQLKMWRQRMPGMDISDVYYPAFLINGKQKTFYPKLRGKIRLRVVNASASTYFWLTFGGGKKPFLIAADGVSVKAKPVDKILHAIAETYDFIIDIPFDKTIEFKATAQDGSGFAAALLGQGDLLKAPAVEKPDPIEYIKEMAEEHHSHSPSTSSSNKKQHHSHNNHIKMQSDHKKHSLESKELHKVYPAQHYDHLISTKKTNFSKSLPVREIKMNLTGNMWRYIWSINGKLLSEADKIKIHKGEILRITLNNKTMMHHPMHLHGHFFRVINSHGDYSPLKHTVDVPPMSQLTIEFEPSVQGDWFFHCHVLYHMKSGMSRIFKYGNGRDSRLKQFPEKRILKADRQWFHWGELELMTHRLNLEAERSNSKNQWSIDGGLSWFDKRYKYKKELEIEGSYEYFFTDFFRWSIGFDIENPALLQSTKDSKFLGKLGFKYLLPYFFDFSLFLNHKLGLEIELDYDLLLFKKIELFVESETHFSQFKNFSAEWELGLKYLMNQNLGLIASYDSDFEWGAGFYIQF